MKTEELIYSCSKCGRIIKINNQKIREVIKEKNKSYCPFCGKKLKIKGEN